VIDRVSHEYPASGMTQMLMNVYVYITDDFPIIGYGFPGFGLPGYAVQWSISISKVADGEIL